MSYHFVTGRLAEHSLRLVLHDLAPQMEFTYTVDVLPITVAALMTTDWIGRHVNIPPEADRVIIPGYCDGDLAALAQVAGRPVERGPRDLRRLPEWFGMEGTIRGDYGAYDIEILAEINHAPRSTLSEILAEANQLRSRGADVIDVGCDPGGIWADVAECVRALRGEGHRVSIDSLKPQEIEPAVRAGAELVLSVNASNRRAAGDWGCPVVAIPDNPAALAGMDDTLEQLTQDNVPYRVDPVLEPIGMGFAASLARYMDYRRKHPVDEMMMGIGNLTELTDVDSAGVNVILLAICQELGIHSVLTTEVINWARTSVTECDLARRLVYHAVRHGTLPKHLDSRLVMLRDPRVLPLAEDELRRLAEQIKDHNYRIFAKGGEVHLVSAGLHLHDRDPFCLLEELWRRQPKNLDVGHAFYLGFEMAKALTALTLSKEYNQDEALDWGFLTEPETGHRPRKPAK